MRTLIGLAVFTAFMAQGALPSRADDQAADRAAEQNDCKDMELVRTGTVTGEGNAVGFIIGVRWGSGTVEMDDGRTFKFKAKGAKVLEVGAVNMTYSGVVYNLEEPEDFAGFYAGMGAGVTLVKGIGGTGFQNTRTCVGMEIKRDDALGLQGSFPMPTGIDIVLAE
ncbi:MAG: hypothetical protein QNJ84_02295 [Alphaproteobacteria bacterium]|nr:hypothetical protein [Alphaproteobacteria bacterium]